MSLAADEAPLVRGEDLEEATSLPTLDIGKQNKEAKTSSAKQLSTAIRTRLVNWRFGVIGWAAAVIVTLFINVGLLVFVSYRRSFNKGIGTLLKGECSKITAYSTGAHLIINVLSTLLLSGSNYCMQCLSAPTRREINNAHKQGIALDIGIPSLRNLAALDPWKVLMWILLGISSLPLHLLSVRLPCNFKDFLCLMPDCRYNSVIYTSLGANNYFVFLVNQTVIERYEDFPPDELLVTPYSYRDSPSAPPPDINSSLSLAPSTLRQLQELALTDKLDKLDNEDCIRSYGKTYLSDRSNLLLVGPNSNEMMLGIFVFNEIIDTPDGCAVAGDTVAWICSEYDCGELACLNNLNEVLEEPQNWEVVPNNGITSVPQTSPVNGNGNVDYCLSSPLKSLANCNSVFRSRWLSSSSIFLRR
jgi:hypothetical protein